MKYILAVSVFVMFLMTGCAMNSVQEDKISDLDFTIVPMDDIQDDILSMIEAKKEGPFGLSYSDGNWKYIVVGYGVQETGGYSIQVDELYDTENTIQVKTTLLGPDITETPAKVPSYPFVVIKTENIDKTVIFEE